MSRSQFDAAASQWDTERRVARARRIAEEIARAVGPAGRSTALEFGCGTGLISFSLGSRFRHITLLDNSPAMIQEVRRKITADGLTGMVATLGDIAALNDPAFCGRPFDAVFSSMVLHHISDVQAALASLSGALRKPGCLCVVDLVKEDGTFHRDEADFTGHNGFEPSEIVERFEMLGLLAVEAREFYHSTKRIAGRDVPYSLFIATGWTDGNSPASQLLP